MSNALTAAERSALLELHDWDELVFGGFYCLHCTPDDEDSLDEPIAWPCQPLREAGVTDDEARALILEHREKAEAEYRAKKTAEQAELQQRVDEFNARYPVGALVFAYPGCRPEDGADTRLVTRTRSKASVLGGHTDVVWVDGHSACIALSHVDVVAAGKWEAARLADAVAEKQAEVAPKPRSVEDELIGANLSLWEEEQENARLRLALESAKRGRRELRARVAELEAARTGAHPGGHSHPEADDVTPQVQKLRALLAGQRAAAETDPGRRAAWRMLAEPLEDPHDSPLHHDYRVPRDLPATGGPQ